SDLTMLRKELVIGFVIAGFADVAVPVGFWRSLFITGHGFWSALENVVLGPFLAIISFVCSIGNVPLAAALWTGGITFGGVVSFVFADLIALPLVLIYRKYYGGRLALRLTLLFWGVMAAAGLVVEGLFYWFDLIPKTRPVQIVMTGFSFNYTSVLNVIFLGLFALLYWLYRNRERYGGGAGYAIDPMCGMQVEIASAPARATADGKTFYFCSDGCRDHFVAQKKEMSPVSTPPEGQ
ncbi:MAG: permease, partial [Actinomycetota bacterium]